MIRTGTLIFMLQPPMSAPGAKLRDLMAKGPVVLPGVFNAITTVAAARAGAPAVYLSGAGVTNALLGVPDIALVTQDEMARQAAYVCQVAGVPVVADADTAFGEGWNAARTVIEMERAGLAGIHIEDQVSPKRCGHLEGKAVIATDHMQAKLRAAVEAKRDASFLVIARTDARGVEGLESAIDRARAYVQAGADAVFPEGLQSESEFEAFRRALDVPLLANMTEFGKTPLIPVSRFGELGYQMVIFPMTAFRMMLKAVSDCYEELVRTGTQAGLLDRMKTRAELYEILGYQAYGDRDRAWGESGGAGVSVSG